MHYTLLLSVALGCSRFRWFSVASSAMPSTPHCEPTVNTVNTCHQALHAHRLCVLHGRLTIAWTINNYSAGQTYLHADLSLSTERFLASQPWPVGRSNDNYENSAKTQMFAKHLPANSGQTTNWIDKLVGERIDEFTDYLSL